MIYIWYQKYYQHYTADNWHNKKSESGILLCSLHSGWEVKAELSWNEELLKLFTSASGCSKDCSLSPTDHRGSASTPPAKPCFLQTKPSPLEESVHWEQQQQRPWQAAINLCNALTLPQHTTPISREFKTQILRFEWWILRNPLKQTLLEHCW